MAQEINVLGLTRDLEDRLRAMMRDTDEGLGKPSFDRPALSDEEVYVYGDPRGSTYRGSFAISFSLDNPRMIMVSPGLCSFGDDTYVPFWGGSLNVTDAVQYAEAAGLYDYEDDEDGDYYDDSSASGTIADLQGFTVYLSIEPDQQLKLRPRLYAEHRKASKIYGVTFHAGETFSSRQTAVTSYAIGSFYWSREENRVAGVRQGVVMASFHKILDILNQATWSPVLPGVDEDGKPLFENNNLVFYTPQGVKTVIENNDRRTGGGTSLYSPNVYKMSLQFNNLGKYAKYDFALFPVGRSQVFIMPGEVKYRGNRLVFPGKLIAVEQDTMVFICISNDQFGLDAVAVPRVDLKAGIGSYAYYYPDKTVFDGDVGDLLDEYIGSEKEVEKMAAMSLFPIADVAVSRGGDGTALDPPMIYSADSLLHYAADYSEPAPGGDFVCYKSVVRKGGEWRECIHMNGGAVYLQSARYDIGSEDFLLSDFDGKGDNPLVGIAIKDGMPKVVVRPGSTGFLVVIAGVEIDRENGRFEGCSVEQSAPPSWLFPKTSVSFSRNYIKIGHSSSIFPYDNMTVSVIYRNTIGHVNVGLGYSEGYRYIYARLDANRRPTRFFASDIPLADPYNLVELGDVRVTEDSSGTDLIYSINPVDNPIPYSPPSGSFTLYVDAEGNVAINGGTVSPPGIKLSGRTLARTASSVFVVVRYLGDGQYSASIEQSSLDGDPPETTLTQAAVYIGSVYVGDDGVVRFHQGLTGNVYVRGRVI